jgi:NAD(P)-dependent dehydrogenase (short-subunit alcohol dehydrogenase family)
MLTNKTAIITGASSGIGEAAALAFARQHAAVVAVGRRRDELEAVVREIEASGARAVACPLDLTKDDAPSRIVATAIERFGSIDIVVNAAGIIGFGTIENTTDVAWDEMLDINLRAPFRLIRAAAPHLIERRGAVVNVSSVNGLRSFPGLLAYCVSKSAIDQLTRCAALELAPKQVRVNSVNPGVTVTNLHRRAGLKDEQYSAFLERSKETHPLGRPGRPEDIAELILFLASDRSSWMTGETIALDGGRHLTCAR